MVKSSAAALKLLLSGNASPLDRKRRRYMGGFLSLFSETPKQGFFVQPFRIVGLLRWPNKNNNLFPRGQSNLSNQAGIADYASPGIFKYLLLWTVFFFCLEGAPQVSLRHPLAFHALWYYRLFIQPLFKLDADRVALDMCKSKQRKQQKKGKVISGHFKYFYFSKTSFFLRIARGSPIGFGTQIMPFLF